MYNEKKKIWPNYFNVVVIWKRSFPNTTTYLLLGWKREERTEEFKQLVNELGSELPKNWTENTKMVEEIEHIFNYKEMLLLKESYEKGAHYECVFDQELYKKCSRYAVLAFPAHKPYGATKEDIYFLPEDIMIPPPHHTFLDSTLLDEFLGFAIKIWVIGKEPLVTDQGVYKQNFNPVNKNRFYLKSLVKE